METKPICPVCNLRFPTPKRKRKYCSNPCRVAARPKRDPEKANAKRRRYYLKNKEKILKRNVKWLKANRDKANESQRNYYWRNRDLIRHKRLSEDLILKARETAKEWKKLNPDKVSANNARQHDRMKFSGMRKYILERDEKTCQDCMAQDIQISVHHIDWSGQTENPNNHPDNLVSLCRSCHRKRHLPKSPNRPES